MVEARRIINIDVKVEYSWRQAHALYLMRSVDCNILWAARTQQNHHWGTLLTTNDTNDPSIETAKTRQRDFPPRQLSVSYHETAQGIVR
ncbi:hypothetical protein AVEN_17500-1 [Araneus ventricosus]|uniref:Uncharacterized protein n=1 Tax=Araneus ventricosus TaxID=182803 RepID=A0A4Y2JG82_ARAVE|nr:hypothetical protein AVEN_17500-1 [Araneus ventricosus]